MLQARQIWLFPGPDHFEGDVLSAQVPLGDFDDHELGAVTIRIDGEETDNEAYLSSDPLLGGYIIVTDVFDTTGETGEHRLEIDATVDGEPLVVAADFVVQPESARPPQEAAASWLSFETDCCLVHYLDATAAARDLETLRSVVESSAAEVEAAFETDIPTMEIVLLDVLWGNGGYASGELVVSYLDRNYGPSTDETVALTFVHELTHGAARTLEGDAPWPLDEAIAVYVTGGHFKPEDVAARASALLESGDLLPLDRFLDDFPDLQHETRYAHAGALAAYLVETYGWDGFLDLYTTDNSTARVSRWFDRAAEASLGVTLEEIDAAFQSWLATIDPTPEARDLELTIALQETRRRYQATYAPYQNFFVYDSVLEAGSSAVALREARDPEFVAVEALIAWAQQLIVDDRLDLAADVIDEVMAIVDTGTIDAPHASRFLAVALALDAAGYELLSLDLEGERGGAVATQQHPELVEFVVELDGGDVTLVGPVTETS